MKKKTFFKISIAVVVALAILLAMNAQVFASISSTDTISVTVDELEEGVTAALYQIITVNYDYTAQQPNDPEYTWNSALVSWLTGGSYSSYINTEDNSVTESFSTMSSTDADAFYSDLAAAIKAGEVSITASATETAGTAEATYANSTTTDSSVTFSSVSMGQYVVLVSGGYRIYSPVSVEVVPTYSSSEWVIGDGSEEATNSAMTVSAKSSPVSIEKTVSSETTSFSTSDSATYTITADTIDYDENAVNTTYVITDVLGNGLSLGETITVYGVADSSTKTTLTKGTDYTLTTTTDETTGETTITVTIINTDILSTYSSIVVEYDVTFNVGTDMDYTNTATLTYSSDQYDPDAEDVEITNEDSEDTIVEIYFYGIEILVTDGTNYLAGAEFTLTDEEGNTIYFVEIDGVYYVVDKDYDGASATVTSTTSGINIQGLSLGDYTITQTGAPDGYLVSSSTFSVTLADDNADGMLNSDTDNTYTITITLSDGFSLPTTGGIGTTIFVATGVVLVVAGLSIMVISSKKKKNNA